MQKRKEVRLMAADDLSGRGELPSDLTPDPFMTKNTCLQNRVVAIASSTGGPQALQTILSQLPASFSAAIVIAQHIGDGFTSGMVTWLGRSTRLKVRMAAHGDILVAGTVHINPSEFSMCVDARGVISLVERDPGQVYRPSCNTLLGSVALAYRERALGLILSGMGDDGVEGMAAIRTAGGATLAQDEATSVVYGMNGLAVARGCIQKVLPLEQIPSELLNILETN